MSGFFDLTLSRQRIPAIMGILSRKWPREDLTALYHFLTRTIELAIGKVIGAPVNSGVIEPAKRHGLDNLRKGLTPVCMQHLQTEPVRYVIDQTVNGMGRRHISARKSRPQSPGIHRSPFRGYSPVHDRGGKSRR